MKLLLDIGNTALHAAHADAAGLHPLANIVHRECGLAAALDQLKFVQPPSSLWVACVTSPESRAVVEAWSQSRLRRPANFVTSTASACGVHNAYAEPARLGVDRWLSVIAAFRELKGGTGAACAVGAGTALTVDVVTAGGQHQGGLIAPGLATQRRSIWGDTQVRARHDAEGLRWLGRDTEEAVAYGTLHGVLGLIERLRTVIEREYPAPKFLLSGGDAPLLLPRLQGSWNHRPHLVLEGLARIAGSQ